MVLMDMDMPKSCKDCRINVYGRCGALRTSVLQEMVNEERNDNCPIKAELPKNATNGDAIMAMFPWAKTWVENLPEMQLDLMRFDVDDSEMLDYFDLKWWNSPWKGRKNEQNG